MKTYIYLLFMLLGMTSCNKFLDETPKGTLIPKTIDDFALMLDSYAFGTDQIAYGCTLTDAMNDDVKIPDNRANIYQNWGIRCFCWEDYIYTEDENDTHYNAFYHIIYICNYILDNVESAEPGNAFSREYVEGAARFHRADAYLNLVNLYAKHYDAQTASTDPGVALLLKADINAVEGRSSVEDVYAAIMEDIEIAEKLLDKTPPEYTFRASRAAAYALEARARLYQGEYAECIEACRNARAITGAPVDFNQYELDHTVNSPDKGLIIDMPWDDWLKPDIIGFKWIGNGPTNSGSYHLSDELMALFDKETDLRWQLFVTTCEYGTDNLGSDEPRISSFMYNANKGYNVGEVYITEAEACVRTNDIDGALEALNTLAATRHVTGTYSEVSERDADKLLRIILDERRREQMFKGTRWFDLKRLNKDPRFAKTLTHVYQGQTYTLEPDNNNYVIAIPPKAIAANPLLEQNPRQE